MKSKVLKSYNIPTDQVLLSVIDAKPSALILLVTGLGMLIFMAGWSYAYGVAIMIVALCCGLFLPRDILMIFFEDYLILYNKADRSSCVLIYYDEVVSWNYSWSPTRDYLNIELIDGSIERIEAFSKTYFESKMKLYLKGKQKKNVG